MDSYIISHSAIQTAWADQETGNKCSYSADQKGSIILPKMWFAPKIKIQNKIATYASFFTICNCQKNATLLSLEGVRNQIPEHQLCHFVTVLSGDECVATARRSAEYQIGCFEGEIARIATLVHKWLGWAYGRGRSSQGRSWSRSACVNSGAYWHRHLIPAIYPGGEDKLGCCGRWSC